MDTSTRRLVSAVAGSVAIGFAFNWLAGVGIFFIAASLAPNDYPRDWFIFPANKNEDD